MKMVKDSQHEVLLPAGQIAPDSDRRALHILDFESHISVELLCKTKTDQSQSQSQFYCQFLHMYLTYKSIEITFPTISCMHMDNSKVQMHDKTILILKLYKYKSLKATFALYY